MELKNIERRYSVAHNLKLFADSVRPVDLSQMYAVYVQTMLDPKNEGLSDIDKLDLAEINTLDYICFNETKGYLPKGNEVTRARSCKKSYLLKNTFGVYGCKLNRGLCSDPLQSLDSCFTNNLLKDEKQ